jgi:hypothetical protein
MFSKEPTVILGALSEVIRQIVPMLIVFGVIHWTSEQVAQFMLVVGSAITLFTILLTRSQVVPNEKANSQIETALAMPPTATVGQVVAKEQRENP